jgi:hypothetical protein
MTAAIMGGAIHAATPLHLPAALSMLRIAGSIGRFPMPGLDPGDVPAEGFAAMNAELAEPSPDVEEYTRPPTGRCPEPVAWRGSWRAPNGRRYRVEACEGHRPPPDERGGPTA